MTILKPVTVLLLAFTLFLPTRAAWSFQVTLDSGIGSTTLTDDDLDGIIDFDITLGGIFQAKGRAFEQLRSDKTIVSLTSTLPGTEASFRNLGVADATFTVTIDSSTFATVGPPLGWALFYSGRTADALAGPVNVSAHSVEARTDAGATLLTTLPALPSVTAENFAVSTSGVHPVNTGADLRVVYTFTLAQDDQIFLPDNNDTDGDAIQVSVFNQAAKCVDKMNNLSRKVLSAAQKSDSKCVTAGVKNNGDDVTSCVDSSGEANSVKAENKLLDAYDDTCAANLPAWGVNGDQCCEGGPSDGDACLVDAGCPDGTCMHGACMSGAAEQAANDLMHDLFGASVDVADGDVIGKCQNDVVKRAGKLIVERWKAFRSCKKSNFETILDDAGLVSTCLGPPQPDPKTKIAKAETKLSDSIDKCIAKGVTPLGSQFPGVCTASADGTIADCMSARAACRFCVAVNLADDISPAVDCDAFDDGLANASCP